MIRRPTRSAAGEPGWLLISQVEHARLAADLARAWGRPPAEPLAPIPDFLAIIEHHDDGWLPWDAAPQVDEQGRPRSFTEMPLADSLTIWQRSIDLAVATSPLGGWLVSGHFTALLEHSHSGHDPGHPDHSAARAFLDLQAQIRPTWLALWLDASPLHSISLAHQALAQLQTFDALSLWLCCEERHTSTPFTSPAGLPWQLDPGDGVDHWVARPGVFRPERLQLSVRGRFFAEGRYQGADLHPGRGIWQTISWLLTRV